MARQDAMQLSDSECSMVLYCLLRRQVAAGKPAEFLLVTKQGHPTFPPTKFRPGEDLYTALVRPMEEDLGLAPGTYFPPRPHGLCGHPRPHPHRPDGQTGPSWTSKRHM